MWKLKCAGLVVLAILVISSRAVAEEDYMTDSGEVREVSGGEIMTDSGEMRDVSEGEYVTDPGEMGDVMDYGEGEVRDAENVGQELEREGMDEKDVDEGA